MKKRGILIGFIIGIFIVSLFIGFASASFTYVNNTINKNYNVGDKAEGRINISFTDEPGDSKFTSNLVGGIDLLGLLKANNMQENVNYNCSLQGCLEDYKAEGNTIGSLAIGGEEKSVGFKIVGDNIKINSVRLELESNAPASCTQPLLADILGKGEKYASSKGYGYGCGIRNYGCFDENAATNKVNIGTIRYCENVSLDAGPAFEVGALITKGTTEDVIIVAELYKQGAKVGECELPEQTLDEEELGCIVEYSSPLSGDYSVCIRSNVSTDYQIAFEYSGDVCGYNTIAGSGVIDYEIFARTMSFDSPLNIKINNTLQAGIVSYIQSYIDQRYNKDCAPRECIVPFVLKSSGSQTVSISGAQVNYDSTAGNANSNGVYILTREKPKVTSPFLNLNIRYANFSVPFSAGNMTFNLLLNNQNVCSVPITIGGGAAFGLFPRVALVGIETQFSAVTDENVTSSFWDFGDGKTQIAAGKSAGHRYDREGEYDLSIELTNAGGIKSRRIFVVMIGDANQSARTLIDRYEKRLVNISGQINSFPAWIGNMIRKEINVTSLGAALARAKADLNNTNISAETIVRTLLDLNVPYSIIISKSSSYPLAIGFNNMNIEYLKNLFPEQIKGEGPSRQDIVNWISKNYGGDAKAEAISRFDDSGGSVMLTRFTVNVNPTAENPGEQTYMFINSPAGQLIFKENYSLQSVSGGTYIPLSGSSQSIEFAVEGEREFSSFGVYLAPEPSKIPKTTGAIERAGLPEFVFSWWLFFLGLGILVVLFLIIFILIQEWFKANMEKGLFPNPDDLYNVLTFIRNSRNKGLSDIEIRKKLEGMGWRRQQIDYAFKRIDSKRVVRFELPIFRAAEKRKMEEELTKRGAGAVGQKAGPVPPARPPAKPMPPTKPAGGVRFIKRP